MDLKTNDLEILAKLQHMFLNSLLGVNNCPGALMLWDLGIMDMHSRVLKEKILLYHHISCLPGSSLALRVMNIQEKLNLPSLREEIQAFLCKFGVYDVKSYSKDRWKKFVRESCVELSRERILADIKKYKKT